MEQVFTQEMEQVFNEAVETSRAGNYRPLLDLLIENHASPEYRELISKAMDSLREPDYGSPYDDPTMELLFQAQVQPDCLAEQFEKISKAKHLVIEDLSVAQVVELASRMLIYIPDTLDRAKQRIDEMAGDHNVHAEIRGSQLHYSSTSETLICVDYNFGVASLQIPEGRAQVGRIGYEIVRKWCRENGRYDVGFHPWTEEDVGNLQRKYFESQNENIRPMAWHNGSKSWGTVEWEARDNVKPQTPTGLTVITTDLDSGYARPLDIDTRSDDTAESKQLEFWERLDAQKNSPEKLVEFIHGQTAIDLTAQRFFETLNEYVFNVSRDDYTKNDEIMNEGGKVVQRVVHIDNAEKLGLPPQANNQYYAPALSIENQSDDQISGPGYYSGTYTRGLVANAISPEAIVDVYIQRVKEMETRFRDGGYNYWPSKPPEESLALQKNLITKDLEKLSAEYTQHPSADPEAMDAMRQALMFYSSAGELGK